jgi:hypothetical protein
MSEQDQDKEIAKELTLKSLEKIKIPFPYGGAEESSHIHFADGVSDVYKTILKNIKEKN